MSKLSGAYLEALQLIDHAKKVLDVGCATGVFSQILRDKLGAVVDGIEIDPAAARQAINRVRKLYVGSVEDKALLDQIQETYDVLIFMDVLEHTRDPLLVLKDTKHLLSESGYIVTSIPNIANWRMRFSLLMGRFEYQATGLLDRGHIRFFTRGSIQALIEDAGYKITQENFTLGGWLLGQRTGVSPLKTVLKHCLLPLCRIRPELFANQFIFKAVKVK